MSQVVYPRGLVLDPLLFILYVNNITDGVQNTLEMFANDSKLYRTIKDSHDMDIQQQDLNYISSWSKLWLLNFNATKYSVMHLGKNSKASYTLFNLATSSNTVLQSTTEQKDLGVWTIPPMNFAMHCHNAANKQTKPWV